MGNDSPATLAHTHTHTQTLTMTVAAGGVLEGNVLEGGVHVAVEFVHEALDPEVEERVDEGRSARAQPGALLHGVIQESYVAVVQVRLQQALAVGACVCIVVGRVELGASRW
jgi:hypothetical protein